MKNKKFSYKKWNKGNFFSNVSNFIEHKKQKEIDHTAKLENKKLQEIDNNNKKNIINTISNNKNETIIQSLLKAIEKWNEVMKIKFNNSSNTKQLIYNLLKSDHFRNYNFSTGCESIFEKYINLYKKDLLIVENITEIMIKEYKLYTDKREWNIIDRKSFLKNISIIGHTLLYNHIENLSFASLLSNIFWENNTNTVNINNQEFKIIVSSLHTDIFRWYDIILLNNLHQDTYIPIDITSIKSLSQKNKKKDKVSISFHSFKNEVYEYNHQYTNYLLGKQEQPNFTLLYPEQTKTLQATISNKIESYIPSY